MKRRLLAKPYRGSDASPDGKRIAFHQHEGAGGDIWLIPDGRWVAYESNESGRQEIYVRPFLTGTGKWHISTGGGTSPHWTDDGKDILFLGGQGGGTVASTTVQRRFSQH